MYCMNEHISKAGGDQSGGAMGAWTGGVSIEICPRQRAEIDSFLFRLRTTRMTKNRGPIAPIIAVGLAVLIAGCASNPSPSEDSERIKESVFLYTPDDMKATVDGCKANPTKECRNRMARVVKAHVDAAKVAQEEDRDWPAKTFALLGLGGSVGATQGGADDIAVGLALITGIESIFDIGEDDGGALQSGDIWERITARMNLPLDDYPLEAVLADLDEYREVAAGE